MEEAADLEKLAIASIERSNWTDEPLTEAEKHVAGMAASSTFYELVVRQRRAARTELTPALFKELDELGNGSRQAHEIALWVEHRYADLMAALRTP